MGEKKSKKPKKDKKHKKHKKHSHHHSDSDDDQEIDYSDPSLWVEAEPSSSSAAPPATTTTAAAQEPKAEGGPPPRHEWMLNDAFDFGSMGTARPKQETKPDPDLPKISHRELNPHLRAGLNVDQYPTTSSSTVTKSTFKFGDAGSKWRMTKLKRVMEQAEDEGLTIEKVGIERYGSLEKLNEALDERAFLDGKKKHSSSSSRSSSRRDSPPASSSNTSKRFMYAETDAASKSFKRPESVDEFGRELKRRKKSPDTSSPLIITQHQMPAAFSSPEPILTRDQLNKLNAEVLKAKLMGKDNAEELEKEYQKQLQLFEAAETGVAEGTDQDGKSVSILPTVDSGGRFYDYALSNDSTISSDRKGKNKERFQNTHDPKTGERLRYGTTDDKISLMDMVRQEKAGSRATSNMDLEFANKIMTDATFENNLDYMDDKAEVMGARKGMTEEQKMRFAVRDYKRTQGALEKCRFCYHDDKSPQCCMVSLATQTYLALPNVQELTPGHCLIVPIQHVTSMLECDDDVWDEVRNFQKCLLQMFNEQGCGVVFMETVTNLRSHRHTAIECIPIPYGVYEEAPAYFKESILGVDEEWSQHKKLIETTSRGFRNSMVKDLPYFHVWCGLDSSYGHVIENSKEFPHWFGKETIAGMLDIGPELWRKPRYHHVSENRSRQLAFLKDWEQWDWTAALPS
ncbi:CwfJ C-terminus 1-domain-containing protein-like protein [Zychaea mexicana]|uniref:CwfJ C-terminus 1-domain-containing protein-like protein n=1 Tax=Zychaea mexicana TaxID=64656 RepID=UPI0022FE3FD8|nr:CwfJ C-terminus 1-domain-containing protein-like protein [Zychaea mexicana]KAI9496028.1 CwfJ C-terminus 1-domain-containing protein-like protein [Zychaea mexicana]